MKSSQRVPPIQSSAMEFEPVERGPGALGKGRLSKNPSKVPCLPPELETKYRNDMAGAWVGPFRRLLIQISILDVISLAAILASRAYSEPLPTQAICLGPIIGLFTSFVLEFVAKPRLHFAFFIFTQIILLSGMTLSAQFCAEPWADRRMMAMGLFVFVQNIFLPLPAATLMALTFVQILVFDLILLSGIGLYSPHENIALAIQSSGFMGLSFLGYQLIEKERRRAWYYNQSEKDKAIELALVNKQLRELSNTDALTGVGNRRSLDHMLEIFWNQAMQSRAPLSVLMVDIDHFKILNDTLGHSEGDICLREIGQALLRNSRQGKDYVARYGGEEFAILLPDMGREAAFEMAERIRTVIEGLPFQSGWRITASLGLASSDYVFPGDTPEAMLRRADKALYQAKLLGRNKTVFFIDQAQEPQNPHLLEGEGGARLETYDPSNCRNGPSFREDYVTSVIHLALPNSE